MKKCPKCKKDYASAVKAAYKLGLLDGENRLQRTITLLKIVNRRLFNELLFLDKKSPLDVNCVKITREYVRKLIKYFSKTKNGNYHKDKLQEMMNIQLGEAETAQSKLRKELEHMEWEE